MAGDAISLVTGGGGFVGRHLVRQLVARGERVRSLGRHRYDHLPGEVEQVVGDITAANVVASACEGVGCVYHTAALPRVWGRRETFERINVGGTRNVVDACRSRGVPRLVHTSTPSVVFGARGHSDADERTPYPPGYLAHYPATKRDAEELVLRANDEVLATVALRPHLVFGPEDQSLMPRVVERARAGRLRIVGDGTNPISVAYVENVAAAHLQAADELSGEGRCAGKAYFINELRPVAAGEWISTLLDMAGEPPCRRRISAGIAYAGGAAMEAVWTVLRKRTEPPMTRFVARQLSEPHSFRIDAAIRDFGYAPPVDWPTALERTRAWAATAFGERGA